MKTAFAALTALALISGSAQRATAGDREWATAGKVLTGIFAASVISRALEPVPVYHTTCVPPPTVVYTAPPPQPAPIVVYQQPVYVAPAPVYLAPAPVYMAAPPAVYVNPPLVSVRLGFGHRHHGAVFRVCP